MNANTAASHTPGPWRVEHQRALSSVAVQGDGSRVARIPADYVTEDGEETHTAEALANARLIAAAPEMLEALRDAETELVEALDFARSEVRERSIQKRLTKIRVAIAKATA
jgi:hypothetical protein